LASVASAFEIEIQNRRVTRLSQELALFSEHPELTATPTWIAGSGGWASYLPRMMIRTEKTPLGTQTRLVPQPEPPYGSHFDEAQWVAVDRDRSGRMVTVSNTRMCLYDGGAKHLAEAAMASRVHVGRVLFSPDGSMVAVSYEDSARIELRSAADLTLLYVPDTRTIQDGNLAQLAFSKDGSVLYAGGSASGPTGPFIRRWEQAGRGSYQDYNPGQGTITALLARPQGGVVFGTDEPAWGVLSEQGTVLELHRRTADSYKGATLLTDFSGERIGLLRGHPATLFSLLPRPLLASGDPDAALRTPRILHPATRVADWREQSRVLVNEKLIKFESPVHSLAIANDGQRAVFGLDSELWWYSKGNDAQGGYWQPDHVLLSRGLWSANPAWAVNFSGDGRWLAAALGDGTVRWYVNDLAQLDRSDPQESLTLYLQSDGKSWVLFTPSGFYDASPGADSFLRWEVERAAGELPESLTAVQLRARYFRPDIVSRVLALGGEAQARFAAHSAAAAMTTPVTSASPDPVATSPFPNLYALLIGVSAYANRGLSLHYPAKDAGDLAALLQRQQGMLYRSVTVRLRTDKQASRQEVLSSLEWLRRHVTDKDVAIIFLAGHGVEDATDGQYYYLPYDADLAQPMTSAVPGVLLREALLSLAGKVVLFLDTCHAGELFSGRGLRGTPDWSRFVAELAGADNGVAVFLASRSGQAAQENKRWGNGAFTKAVIEGLSGQADRSQSGRVTLNMLDLYISERVKGLTGGTQTPTSARPTSITDFPLTVRISR
jgi:WD40 repeat protein